MSGAHRLRTGRHRAPESGHRWGRRVARPLAVLGVAVLTVWTAAAPTPPPPVAAEPAPAPTEILPPSVGEPGFALSVVAPASRRLTPTALLAALEDPASDSSDGDDGDEPGASGGGSGEEPVDRDHDSGDLDSGEDDGDAPAADDTHPDPGPDPTDTPTEGDTDTGETPPTCGGEG